MATWVTPLTASVVIVNVAVVAPASTVTPPGTVAAVILLLDNVTNAPPVGAAPLSVTVPVDDVPPLTVVGLTVTEVKMGGPAVAVVKVKSPDTEVFPDPSVLCAR